MNNTSIFSNIYLNKLWGSAIDDIYCSGDGSRDTDFTSPYCKSIEKFITSLGYKPDALDIGCGNFLVGSQIRKYFNEYKAIDVVPHVIENNKNMYKTLDVDFINADAEIDELPNADIVMIRQVFQHLSNETISSILQKLKKYKYLILTEHLPIGNFTPNMNMATNAGCRYPESGVIITEEPFNFSYIEKQEICAVDGKEYGGIIVTTVYKLL